jgi:group I intron endonuclease
MNTFVVYQIKNKIDNKIYVGSTNNISKRWHTHRKKLSTNKHHSPYLQNAWNKYGEDCFIFEVLETLQSKKEMLDCEQKWLNKTLCYDKENGYNTCKVAGSPLGHKHTEEAKRKISNRMKGENHPLYGKTLSNEHKARISSSNIGKIAWNRGLPASEKERLRLKQIRSEQIIRPCSDETKNKISEKLMGHIVSESTREKLRIANVGKCISEETRKKISQTHKRKRAVAKLSIEQVLVIREMLEKKEHSQSEIAKMFSISQTTVSAIKRNKLWRE